MNISEGTQSPAENSDSQQLMKLGKLLRNGDEIIYSIRTVFPFRIFPQMVSVDKKKVNIVRWYFFGTEQITTVLIQDIAGVHVSTNLFFANLTIHARLPGARPISVNYLPKFDALKMQEIMEGLLMSKYENIDISNIPPQQLNATLQHVGNVKNPAEKDLQI